MEHTELYDLLQVSKDSTDAEIKQNYRRLAKEFHPDKNPEAGDKFKEISFAYEVLSNPDKRQIYDRFGLKGLQEGGEGFSDGNASDFFHQWFPFGGATHFGGAGPSSRPKVAQVVVKLEVTLEEIFNGNVSKTVDFKRTEYCAECESRGGPKEALEKCPACNGSGKTASMTIMGMGSFESTCGNCYGRGNVIRDDMRCKICAGAGLVQEDQSREVTVEKGAPNMLKINYPAEGNQPLTGERGDLVVVLVQVDHPTFIRRQNDLFLRDIHVTLTQALCGYVHCFEHLDGRKICINTKPGEVIRHGDMKTIPGEGMPLRNNPFERGDLFVEFHVEFPENNFATAEQMQQLEEVLPPREPFEMPEDAEEVHMQDIQPYGEDFRGAAGGTDDEDDYESGANIGGVQCQTA